MYQNYGDRNFFENGMLVDTEHSDTTFPMLLCTPYPDEEDLFQFGECEVDISDDWIDRKAVMDYIGMAEETFDPVAFAIGCVSWYSWDNFGAINYAYDWTRMDKKSICDILKYREIASDNLDIDW
ncbi:MAG: hypothetical protein LUE86_08000 [Clostridiales bacterium]|nr:hypothetical protein [Clostridiales bacterium]